VGTPFPQVTAQISPVNTYPLVPDPVTHLLSITIDLINGSPAAVNQPVNIVFQLSPGVTLEGASGTLGNRPFVTVPVGLPPSNVSIGSGIAPGVLPLVETFKVPFGFFGLSSFILGMQVYLP